MKITVLFFAHLRQAAGLDSVTVELPSGATVRGLAAELESRLPVSLRGCMAAVNEAYAGADTPLQEGDEVAFLPPVAGGSGPALDCCAVTHQPLSLEQAAAFLVRPEWGAQSYFVGTVRSPNRGEVVEHIRYEAYSPMAQRVMAQAAQEARARWGELGVFLAHRTGELQPGEASMLIGVGSPHRRAALEAVDWLTETLKVRLPVWKLERLASGEHWVEGSAPAQVLD
ncbi:molybdopterin converting factor subunit 1 [Deinococcus lacus]|uniref:Molybdopterin converting factor subunit 1 n=1 Tax=Deinococcus lacus TaxID=392561 RepID=A0ABW1YER4_9DEIO